MPEKRKEKEKEKETLEIDLEFQTNIRHMKYKYTENCGILCSLASQACVG